MSRKNLTLFCGTVFEPILNRTNSKFIPKEGFCSEDMQRCLHYQKKIIMENYVLLFVYYILWFAEYGKMQLYLNISYTNVYMSLELNQ